MYKCGICGKEYETIEGRMHCEIQCFDIKKKEREKNTIASLEKKVEEYSKEYEVACEKMKLVKGKMEAAKSALVQVKYNLSNRKNNEDDNIKVIKLDSKDIGIVKDMIKNLLDDCMRF